MNIHIFPNLHVSLYFAVRSISIISFHPQKITVGDDLRPNILVHRDSVYVQWYCSTSLVMLRSFQQNLITFVYLYPATLTCLLHTFLGKSWLLYMPEMGVNVRLLNLDITLSNTFCTYYGHYSRNGPLMMMMGTTLFLFSKAFNHVICQI